MQALIDAANTMTDDAISAMVNGHKDALGMPLYVHRDRRSLVGLVRNDIVALVLAADGPLVVEGGAVFFADSYLNATPLDRTLALEQLLIHWRDDPANTLLHASKWRSERYSVWDFDGKIAFMIERSAAGLLGIRSYGCHVNGFVKGDSRSPSKMWVARRSYTKQTYPGMLDNIVGGGLPHGMTPGENVIKECFEEAGIEVNVANSLHVLKPVSVLTAFMISERGWVPDTEYIYDLEVDASFTPLCQDGEVHGFELMDLATVKTLLLKGEFMPESGLVVLDFMIRHGYLDASTEPDYVAIVTGLHRTHPFPGPCYA
ncbi:hypothetical protein HDU81_009945 [Chytriomyces hyalinus]|nr:hypothetical protein HDU81_009945 [Chytriomyces hyalinus]